MSKGGTMVAIVQSLREGDNSRRYISVGDKVGEKRVWKNTFVIDSYENPNLIAIDDTSKHIAVFGRKESEGKPQLLIDDIPYDIPGNPERLEYLAFENGNLTIAYTNALNEKIAEVISLNEGAQEIQSAKEKKEAGDFALIELRRQLIDEQIPLETIVARLKKVESHDQEIEKNKNLQLKIEALQEKNLKLEMELKEKDESNKDKVKSLEMKVAESDAVVKKLENLFKGAKDTTFGSDKKLSAESVQLALSLIKELGGKHNWDSEKN